MHISKPITIETHLTDWRYHFHVICPCYTQVDSHPYTHIRTYIRGTRLTDSRYHFHAICPCYTQINIHPYTHIYIIYIHMQYKPFSIYQLCIYILQTTLTPNKQPKHPTNNIAKALAEVILYTWPKRTHYQPCCSPMVTNTHSKIHQINSTCNRPTTKRWTPPVNGNFSPVPNNYNSINIQIT